jgi:hypothetical protein
LYLVPLFEPDVFTGDPVIHRHLEIAIAHAGKLVKKSLAKGFKVFNVPEGFLTKACQIRQVSVKYKRNSHVLYFYETGTELGAGCFTLTKIMILFIPGWFKPEKHRKYVFGQVNV